MKKLILSLLLLVSFNIYSQNYIDFRSNVMIITNGQDTKVFDSNVLIRLYIDANRIIINSKSIQIIDYDVTRTYIDKDEYFNIDATATDTNYKRILLNIAIDKSTRHLIVGIEYSDIGYSYSAYQINDQNY